MANEKYFNVPVQLLSGFMQDSTKTLNNIFDFAVCLKAESLEGTEAKRLRDAASYFSATIGNERKTVENGKRLINSIPANSPMTGISLPIFWDYYKNYKSDFEKVCLLAFLALKSIIGKKAYSIITNNFWLARMDGMVKAVKDISELSIEIRKYSNEYQLRKLKYELFDSWSLKFYSYHLRGCYYSFSLTLQSLVNEAERNRKSNRVQAANKAIKEARQKATATLKVNHDHETTK